MNTPTKMSNDFGRPPVWRLVYGREAVEDRIAIKVSDLTWRDVWEERNIPELKQLSKKFRMSGVEMELKEDPDRRDWYIELVNSKPTCFSTVINLIVSRCRYGGRRYWFECPRCIRRVGVLYKDGDDFQCRRCLNLDYRSHLRNYRSLEPAIIWMHKFEEMEIDFRRKYNGKDTKKMKRFWKIKGKAEAAFALFEKKFDKYIE